MAKRRKGRDTGTDRLLAVSMLAYCLHLAEIGTQPRTDTVPETAERLADLPVRELIRLADLLLDYPQVAPGVRVALDALRSTDEPGYGA